MLFWTASFQLAHGACEWVEPMSGVPRDAGGYGEILAAINKITTPANVTKIFGENWFRVLDSAKG